jgi:hypothetical protein
MERFLSAHSGTTGSVKRTHEEEYFGSMQVQLHRAADSRNVTEDVNFCLEKRTPRITI